MFFFCLFFTRGYESKGAGEGVRCGIQMGLFFMTFQAFDACGRVPVALRVDPEVVPLRYGQIHRDSCRPGGSLQAGPLSLRPGPR